MRPSKGEAESSTPKQMFNKKDTRSCHQCKNIQGTEVKCSKCHKKNYCFSCRTKWYPGMEEAAFMEACPCCRKICNRKECLEKGFPIPVLNLIAEDRILFSKHIVRLLLPSLKQFLAEEQLEKEEEAKLRGLSVAGLALTTCRIDQNEEKQCNKCKTSILNIHRSCPNCAYGLCVLCCQDIRDQEHNLRQSVNLTGIRCPPADKGGCGQGSLDLTSIYPENLLSKVLANAEAVSSDTSEISARACSCHQSYDGSEVELRNIRRAASRDGISDNYLFCASALDIEGSSLRHFQWHLSNGEPVIVGNVLAGTYGLSWEPMVMARACECGKKNPIEEFTVRNRLNWCEERIKIRQFFKGYVDGIFDHQDRLKILQLEDWPPSESFKERVPRHYWEFIQCIPFKEYTFCAGFLNIICKVPETSWGLDLGPKLCVGYGGHRDLELGSITKLQYAIADRVNVLMHTAGIAPQPTRRQAKKLKWANAAQAAAELSGRLQGSEDPEVGALWDIFRRQDVPLLEEYLRNHSGEFRDNFRPSQMIHPIHDQAFYLTVEHKRKLKQEYGIEPWTFVQRLGDAVFVPAGCPHQIRNLKSCTSVAVNFVSPESVRECIRLSEEYRHLPSDHRCKEDKLQVKRLVFHAVRKAVDYLEKMIPHASRNTTQKPFGPVARFCINPPLKPKAVHTGLLSQSMEALSNPMLKPMEAGPSQPLTPTEVPSRPILQTMGARVSRPFKPTGQPAQLVLGAVEAGTSQSFKPTGAPTEPVFGQMEAGTSQSLPPSGATKLVSGAMEAGTSRSFRLTGAPTEPIRGPTEAGTSRSFNPWEPPAEPIFERMEAGTSQAFNLTDAHTTFIPAAQGAKPDLAFMWNELAKMKTILLNEGEILAPEVRANIEDEIEGLLRKIGSQRASSSSLQQP